MIRRSGTGSPADQAPVTPTPTHRQVTPARQALCRGRRSGFTRRDDLVGGPPGEFRHVIEPGGERSGTRRCRAYLDDEVADLGFGHHRLDDIPAGPALARVETEDLS